MKYLSLFTLMSELACITDVDSISCASGPDRPRLLHGLLNEENREQHETGLLHIIPVCVFATQEWISGIYGDLDGPEDMGRV